jgi:hypothetical protein
MDSEFFSWKESVRIELINRTIFTGGSDCLVRIHKANDPDAEPGFHDNHEDAVTSISCTVCPQMSRKYPGLD